VAATISPAEGVRPAADTRVRREARVMAETVEAPSIQTNPVKAAAARQKSKIHAAGDCPLLAGAMQLVGCCILGLVLFGVVLAHSNSGRASRVRRASLARRAPERPRLTDMATIMRTGLT